MASFSILFARAKAGDATAITKLLSMYMPLLYKEAVIAGIFDEDLFQELCLVFLKCIAKFNIM